MTTTTRQLDKKILKKSRRALEFALKSKTNAFAYRKICFKSTGFGVDDLLLIASVYILPIAITFKLMTFKNTLIGYYIQKKNFSKIFITARSLVKY